MKFFSLIHSGVTKTVQWAQHSAWQMSETDREGEQTSRTFLTIPQWESIRDDLGTHGLRESHSGDFLTQKVAVSRARNKGQQGGKGNHCIQKNQLLWRQKAGGPEVSRAGDVGPNQRGGILPLDCIKTPSISTWSSPKS